MTLAGQVAKILSVFGLVFVTVIILHWVTLALQYLGGWRYFSPQLPSR